MFSAATDKRTFLLPCGNLIVKSSCGVLSFFQWFEMTTDMLASLDGKVLVLACHGFAGSPFHGWSCRFAGVGIEYREFKVFEPV
jgi:hypothetical protein